jgi:hypothetical protein
MTMNSMQYGVSNVILKEKGYGFKANKSNRFLNADVLPTNSD